MMYNKEFDLSEQLRERGISRIAKANNTIVIDYGEKSIRFDIVYDNWMRTIKNFEESSKGIIKDPNLIQRLKSFFNKRYNEIVLENDNNSLSNIKNNGKEIVKIFKYSKYGKIALHEAIILDDKPVFIKYDHDNKRIEIVENIVETTRIIIPPSREEYPYTPYEFENLDELNKIFETAKRIESIDELYQTSKRGIYQNYIDQGDHIITILVADSILTYFQDQFPTIHYSEGIGDNDVGKSSIGFTFEYTAYRVVKGTSISGPNYNRVLGTIEPGQCTIVEDEGDSISEDHEKVKILKSGYEYNSKIPKINMNTKEQDQNWYYPYCYKMILAEKSLNQSKAKGLVDRTFSFHCKPGKVKYSIKDVVSENINKSQQSKILYNQILFFRKLMLCYRIIHYRDPLPTITTGLTNRENELIKPLLQLFYGSEVLSEIIDALKIFVKQRRERKSNSVEAVLYPIIKELIDDLNTVPNLISIPFSMIWGKITDCSRIEGNYDLNTPNQYETQDYIIYKNTLSKLIRDKFGAKLERKPYGSSLIFNKAEFAKFDKVYDNSDPTLIKLEVKSEIICDDLGGEENYDEIDRMLNSVDSVSNEGNEGKSKCVGSDTISKEDENNIIENENSLENSVDVREENVGYVDNEGISERVCINKKENENEIITKNVSMKDNSQNNNLPIFNYNYNNKIDSLSENNNKKSDTHLLEPAQPTLSTSFVEESSKLQCLYCDYKGIEVDLDLHIYEKHRDYLRRLQHDSLDFNIRTDYVIEGIKAQEIIQ